MVEDPRLRAGPVERPVSGSGRNLPDPPGKYNAGHVAPRPGPQTGGNKPASGRSGLAAAPRGAYIAAKHS
jgi:hypothetical protein